MCVAYTCSCVDICPITFEPLSEMDCLVSFCSMPSQPYKSTALTQWLKESQTNPMTNQQVRSCRPVGGWALSEGYLESHLNMPSFKLLV